MIGKIVVSRRNPVNMLEILSKSPLYDRNRISGYLVKIISAENINMINDTSFCSEGEIKKWWREVHVAADWEV